MRVMRAVRRSAGAAKRRLFPAAELKAWHEACRQAERARRRTPGRIELAGYSIEYADLLTLCPQWHDIFVRGALDFETSSPAPRILDCGANLGLASLYFKRRHPSARITAFEADPVLSAILGRNLGANGAADVELIRAAVWTRDGEVRFRAEGADAGAIDGLPGGVDAAPIVTVPCVRLADVIAREPVDLLKLDVEGAERAILQDCEAALPGVAAMIIDLHEFDPSARAAPAVFDLLARSGFTYAASELVPLPWRAPVAASPGPFPRAALCWAMTIRAWRR
jgi:FkbM family methyltransferase